MRTSFREEFSQATLQLGRISCPAFPDYKHSPVHGPEGFDVPSVPINIPPTLLLPELCVGRGSNPAVPTAVHVPETAVDKDHLAMTRQHNIRRARQLSPMQAESVSHAMNRPAHDDLRLRVPATDARHAEPALFSIQHISHEYGLSAVRVCHSDGCTGLLILSRTVLTSRSGVPMRPMYL